MRNMYADAVQCQDACNLSGVLKSWATYLDAIWAEARAQNKGTDFVNNHPVNVLFADKLYSLTGYGSRFSEAYAACKAEMDKANARESVSA